MHIRNFVSIVYHNMILYCVSVAANFEVMAASKLAAGEISNFDSFEVTYVTSKLHCYFLPEYRI